LIEFINSYILPSQEIAITIAVLAIFLFAGIIKGFLGIGLPAAAMAFLTLVMDPTIAISLLTLPIIFTNIMQYAGCENPRPIARKYWVFALAIIVSIFITSFFILSYPKAILTISIGLAMIAFSLTQMTGARLPIGGGYGWHIGVGLFSGVLGGLSSIWSPPVAMYLLARDVDKSEFIGATGFLFLAGSLPLAAGLALAGVLTIDTVLHSLMGLIVVLIGFRIGEMMRNHVPQGIFRKIVLWAFLIMGARLLAIGLF
jgi:uncharacterized membrane protein YfcA